MTDIKEMPEDLRKECGVEKLYKLFRFINPENHGVYLYDNGQLMPQNKKCYEIWNRTEPCINCISKRASLGGKKVIKMEYSEDKVFLVCSMPVSLVNPEKYVLELADDVTDSFFVNLPVYKNNTDLNIIVSAFNDIAAKDTFTNLYNKKYIEQELPYILQKANSDKHKICAALFDIDKFKLINEKYGHIYGDRVLIAISGYIKDLIYSRNICGARIGNDEFLIIFQDKNLEDSKKLCSLLSDNISAHIFGGVDNDSFSVTVSYGLDEYKIGESPDDFLAGLMNKMDEARRVKY